MGIKLNFKNVPTSFSLPQEGLHEATIFAVDEKTTKKGDPMLVIRWKLEESGAIVYDNLPIMESTMWRVAQFMNALGYSDFGEEEFELEPDELVGDVAILRIQHREYNGEAQAQVSKYLPINEAHSSTSPSHTEDAEFDSPTVFMGMQISEGAVALLETLDVEEADVIAANPGASKITVTHVRAYMKNS